MSPDVEFQWLFFLIFFIACNWKHFLQYWLVYENKQKYTAGNENIFVNLCIKMKLEQHSIHIYET